MPKNRHAHLLLTNCSGFPWLSGQFSEYADDSQGQRATDDADQHIEQRRNDTAQQAGRFAKVLDAVMQRFDTMRQDSAPDQEHRGGTNHRKRLH